MRSSTRVTIAVLGAFVALTVARVERAGAQNEPPKVYYRLTLKRQWSPQTHPGEFPPRGRFSAMTGIPHSKNWTLFKEGGTASYGLEMLAEEGESFMLLAEFKGAVRDKLAGTFFSTYRPLIDPDGEQPLTLDTDERFPLVSFAAMLMPSPDWFTGVSGVALYENGAWVEEKTVPLYVYDAGTDSETHWVAFDKDTEPSEPIRLCDAPFFMKDGKPIPVGSVTFKKQDAPVPAEKP